jgi:hypothetical protein
LFQYVCAGASGYLLDEGGYFGMKVIEVLLVDDPVNAGQTN